MPSKVLVDNDKLILELTWRGKDPKEITPKEKNRPVYKSHSKAQVNQNYSTGRRTDKLMMDQIREPRTRPKWIEIKWSLKKEQR